MDEHRVATFLGWFSIGLGAAELLAPRTLTRYLDVGGREPVVRAFGAREVAAGVGILSRRNRTPWLWGRVAGDAVDLGGLVAALRGNRRARFVATAIASVVAVTVLDVVCGMKSSEGPSAPQFA